MAALPADLIHRLLNDRPALAGLAVPGMPAGVPGMPEAGLRLAVHVALTGQEWSLLLTASPLAGLYATAAGLVAIGIYRGVTGES